MSDPYRWRVADNQTQRTLGGNIMELHEIGPYVLWHDYARLKAEVERLTKAGDAMATGLQGMAGERPKALADEWNDAKEGKQS